jgi:LPS-assembly protein
MFPKENPVTKLLPRLIITGFLLSLSFAPIVPDASAASAGDPSAQKTPEAQQQDGQTPSKQSVATEEWDITADKITRYENPESIVAEGNIVLIKRKKMPAVRQPAGSETEGVSEWFELLEEEQPEKELTLADIETDLEPTYRTEITIKADWVAYDVTLSTIKARGNIFVEADGQSIAAEQAVINLEQETGTFKKATIIGTEKQMHLEGEVIEKIGFKTYHIVDGWVITCKIPEGEKAPWSFAASDVVVEQDGYAKLKNARFRIKDVPVMYSPWLMLPVKNKRETGFLLPELSSSDNNGFGFDLPFFWNISDSTDLTIYTQYFAERGYMPSLEFRYITAPFNKGLVWGSYLNDELSDPSETAYYEDTGFTHDNQDRYWFRAKADQDIAGWTSRLDLDIVSDRDYLTEFNTGMTGFKASNEQFRDVFGRSLENKTDDQRTNTFGIQKSWGAQSFTGRLLGINDVRPDVDVAEGELPGTTPIWNLPSLVYIGTIPFENLYDLTLQWDASYYNFWREEGIGGHRFDIYPKLSTPLPISPYLESRAEVGIRDTYYMINEYGEYQWDKDDTQNRFLYDLHGEIGSTLIRPFAMKNATRSDGFIHEVRPYVNYDFVPDEDQTDLPSFDGVDRIIDRNEFTYGIDNFFNGFFNDGRGDDVDYGWFKIKQAYSLRSEDSDEPFSDINFNIRWLPIGFLELEYQGDFDVYESMFVKHDFDGTYRTRRGDLFSLEYFFTDYLDTSRTEQINARIEAALLAGFSVKLSVEHSIANDETNEANIALLYQALCWSMELGSQYTPEETTFMLVFSLANLGSPFRFNY